jgi:hypothetical protein
VLDYTTQPKTPLSAVVPSTCQIKPPYLPPICPGSSSVGLTTVGFNFQLIFQHIRCSATSNLRTDHILLKNPLPISQHTVYPPETPSQRSLNMRNTPATKTPTQNPPNRCYIAPHSRVSPLCCGPVNLSDQASISASNLPQWLLRKSYHHLL